MSTIITTFITSISFNYQNFYYCYYCVPPSSDYFLMNNVLFSSLKQALKNTDFMFYWWEYWDRLTKFADQSYSTNKC